MPRVVLVTLSLLLVSTVDLIMSILEDISLKAFDESKSLRLKYKTSSGKVLKHFDQTEVENT